MSDVCIWVILASSSFTRTESCCTALTSPSLVSMSGCSLFQAERLAPGSHRLIEVQPAVSEVRVDELRVADRLRRIRLAGVLEVEQQGRRARHKRCAERGAPRRGIGPERIRCDD